MDSRAVDCKAIESYSSRHRLYIRSVREEGHTNTMERSLKQAGAYDDGAVCHDDMLHNQFIKLNLMSFRLLISCKAI